MNTNQMYPGALSIPIESYHADTTHISKSGLDLINRSPAHYWAKYLDPDRVPEEPKKHFIIGSITHTAILEPHYLEQHYFVLDDVAKVAEIGGGNPRATNRYKEWKAEQLARAGGRQEVNIADWDAIRRMRDSVWKHPAAAALLATGYAEQSFFTREFQTDGPIKFRPDWLNDDIRWISDVKTTDDASPAGFGKSFFNFRYHVQAALIMDGMAALEGVAWEGIAFIAVEKNPPYAVAVYTPSEGDLELGRSEYLGNLQTYMACKENNSWPAYGGEVQMIQRPGWVSKR